MSKQTYPGIGALLLVKSVLDIGLRIVTDQPVVSIVPPQD